MLTPEEQIEIIENSGLFDSAYYLRTNHDVRAAGMDPIVHFVYHGAEEMRNPSSKFEVSFYLEQNPDVAKNGINPFVHYILHGKREGRLPMPKMKYFLTIAACIKNEGKYLDEWLSYHIYQGVEHFYLNNDESTDNTLEVLKPYIEKGYVTVYEGLRKQGILQMEYYAKIIHEKKYETEWCGFFDVDEFYQGDEKLKDFLKGLRDTVSGVELSWKFFGDSGLEKYDDRYVTERFVHHCLPDFPSAVLMKSVCRLRNLEDPQHSVHVFYYRKGTAINSLKEDVINISGGRKVMRPPLWKKCWLNHYYTKTKEEYINGKINRGDVNARVDNYKLSEFESHNRNEIFDDSMVAYVNDISKIQAEITGKAYIPQKRNEDPEIQPASEEDPTEEELEMPPFE